MAELTSGFVAGIIAAALLIARISFPTALSFILAGQLKDGETAATWTAASAPLQGSYWPVWLRADQSKSHGVRKSVSLLTLALPTLAILTAIASVVTPLGLYEEDVVQDPTNDVSFVYAPDSSAFSMATSPRSTNTSFTRQCTLGNCWVPCPYTVGKAVYEVDSLGTTCSTDDLDMKVPDVLRSIYSSGTKALRTTVSNFFDIEWRQMTTNYNRFYNNGTYMPAGTFRHLQSFTLEEEPLVVEGLVVDAANGGIGFRNHTVPVGMPRGATWSEDLLFIEPDVVCINQNVTIDFKVSTNLGGGSNTISMTNLALTDRGGFVNINHTHPLNDTRDGPNQPDLRMRALTAAWNFNRFTMFALNISNPGNITAETEPFEYITSEIGKEFKLPKDSLAGGLDAYQSLAFLRDFGSFLGFTAYSFMEDDLEFDNPHNITGEYFVDTRELCEMTFGTSPTFLNSTYVACTMVRGVPRRTDGGQSTIFDDGSTWSSPLYTCASSVRATIKEATFFHNGTTSNVDNLRVKNIEEKTYSSEKDMPLWGVEESYFQLSEWSPIWGLVDPAYEGFQNVSTVRQPWFYLLGTAEAIISSGLSQMYTMDNVAGAIAPLSAMTSVTAGLTATTGVSLSDFTAQGSMSLWLRWRELSSAAESLPLIFKLLWTDLAASAMVGTKGVLGEGNAQPELAVGISARRTVHSVRYHYAFGIPAFATALALLVVILLLCLSIATGHSSLKIMDQRLKQTSLGRSLTTLVSPQSSTYDMSSKDWAKANGHRYLDLGGTVTSPVDVAPQQSGVQFGTSEHVYTSLARKPVGGYNVEEYQPRP